MYVKNQETLHNCVSKLRATSSETQAELARQVGVTRQTIIAIEKGDYVPSVLLAIKLSQHFNQSVEKVFYV